LVFKSNLIFIILITIYFIFNFFYKWKSYFAIFSCLPFDREILVSRVTGFEYYPSLSWVVLSFINCFFNFIIRYWIIGSWALLVVSLFFVSLSRSYISSSRLVELTQVDLSYFLDFFYEINFFVQFYYLKLNYWPLSFVIFLLFFLWGHPEFRLVKLT